MRRYALGMSLWVYQKAFALIDPVVTYSTGLESPGVTDNLSDAQFFLIKLAHAVCLLTGLGLCLGALVQYKAHRRNPVSPRLSVPIWMMIFGCLMIGLIYLPSPFAEAIERAA